MSATLLIEKTQSGYEWGLKSENFFVSHGRYFSKRSYAIKSARRVAKRLGIKIIDMAQEGGR